MQTLGDVEPSVEPIKKGLRQQLRCSKSGKDAGALKTKIDDYLVEHNVNSFLGRSPPRRDQDKFVLRITALGRCYSSNQHNWQRQLRRFFT